MAAFAIEEETLPSSTTRILNLVPPIFLKDNQAGTEQPMLYTYKKTRLNSLPFESSLCVKNNDHRKNTLTSHHCS